MVLKRVALTGASGMVGRHLLRALHDRGILCAATSRSRPPVLPAGSTWSPWDLRDWKEPEELDRLFDTVDAVFHVGALVPDGVSNPAVRDLFDVNVRASFNLGLWARQHNIPLIYLSGSTVYADPLRNGVREDDPKQSGYGVGGVYGMSKWLSEQVLTALADQEMRICILRPSSIYGTGLPSNKMIPQWLQHASCGEAIVLEQPINDTLDLIHASDVVQAMIDAVEHESWGVFNIASECPETIEAIARMCVTVVGEGSVAVAKRAAERPARVRFGLVCDRARDAFGFAPRVDLVSGIRRVWEEVE